MKSGVKLQPIQNQRFGAIPTSSYRDEDYESELMKSLVQADEKRIESMSKYRVPNLQPSQESSPSSMVYHSRNILPEWLLASDDWKSMRGRKLANEVSDILKISVTDRTKDQVGHLVEWLMSVWPLAALMGFKRVTSMLKEFTFVTYLPGQVIVQEGEHGSSFFVIISGDVEVIKDNVGVVGHLTRGATFGEIALTNQSHDKNGDRRTATIKVIGNSPVEALTLHKVDYDHYIKDVQLVEKRENFVILKESKLLENWPRSKLEKLSNTALRRVYKSGEVIFKQGDPSNHIFFVFEGSVKIVKEVSVVASNRWPIGSSQWHERRKKIKLPIVVSNLEKGDYFGEVAVLRNCPRTATAIVQSARTILILIDRIEFLHTFVLVSRTQSVTNIEDEVKKYKADADVLQEIERIKGGPSSFAMAGRTALYPNQRRRSLLPASPTTLSPVKQDSRKPSTETNASFIRDINETIGSLFPHIENKEWLSASIGRKKEKRNVRSNRLVNAKDMNQASTEKTKESMVEIINEIKRHEAIQNYNMFLSLQSMDSSTSVENMDLNSSISGGLAKADSKCFDASESLDGVASPRSRVSTRGGVRPVSKSAPRTHEKALKFTDSDSDKIALPNTGVNKTKSVSETNGNAINKNRHIKGLGRQKLLKISSSANEGHHSSGSNRELSQYQTRKSPHAVLDMIFSPEVVSPKNLIGKSTLTYKDVMSD